MKNLTFLRRFVLAFLLVALAVTPTLAQGKWWQADHHVRKELGLTNEQAKRIDDIFQAASAGLRTAKQTLDKEESALEAILERGTEKAFTDQLNRVEYVRASLNVSRRVMLFRMMKVLTKDQAAKFSALAAAAERERTQKPHPSGGK